MSLKAWINELNVGLSTVTGIVVLKRIMKARHLLHFSSAVHTCCATASVWCTVPVRKMLLEPVIEVPAYRPTFPVMVVGPVLVTVEAPRTAKLPAESSIESADVKGA